MCGKPEWGLIPLQLCVRAMDGDSRFACADIHLSMIGRNIAEKPQGRMPPTRTMRVRARKQLLADADTTLLDSLVAWRNIGENVVEAWIGGICLPRRRRAITLRAHVVHTRSI
jgi:hypothetical protein